MTRLHALSSAAVVATTMFASQVAGAQPSGQDVATAQALFDEAKRLMGLSKFAEACPKLLESQRLDPAGGTLIALALCHEGEGKTATAWAEFNVALGEARKDKRADREAAALEHIKALEPKLTRLRVVVEKKVDGLEVRRDGAIVGEAQWGVPLPIDPGEHTFEARAPKKKTIVKTATIAGAGATSDVNIPVLEDDPLAVTSPPPARKDERGPEGNPPADDNGRGTRLTIAAITAGVGVVATGVAIGFSLSANSKWSNAHEACPANKCTNSSDVTLGESAGRAADIATVLYIVGGAALAAGATLWLTAPSARSTGMRSLQIAPNVSTSEAGLSVGGRL